MASRVIPVEPFDIVIFGVTGDLARRKILPGLFHRFLVGQIPENAQVIGSSRTEMDESEFRELVRACLLEFAPQASEDAKALASFLGMLSQQIFSHSKISTIDFIVSNIALKPLYMFLSHSIYYLTGFL